MNNLKLNKWKNISAKKNTVLEVIKNSKRKLKFQDNLEKLISVAEAQKTEELAHNYINYSLEINSEWYKKELEKNIERIEEVDAQDDENYIWDGWYSSWYWTGLKEALDMFINHDNNATIDDIDKINNEEKLKTEVKRILDEWYDIPNWWPQFKSCVEALDLICDFEWECWSQSGFLIDLRDHITELSENF